MSPMTFRLASLALVAAALAGCTGAGKREAASLVSAVDAYRHAPGPAKVQRGKAVGEVECSEAKVCEAKTACVAAIEPTVRALALKDEVAARVGELEKGTLAKDSPEAQALPGKLDEAERLLQDGRAKMQACDAKLTDLHVDYGV
jgi:hypothetical protein